MRFVAFWGSAYYPGGGAEDSHKAFATEAEASVFANAVIAGDCLTWSHVWDSETDTIVKRFKA